MRVTLLGTGGSAGVPLIGGADGSGDVPDGKGGTARFDLHESDCDQHGDSADFSDPDSETDFHSTRVDSVRRDNVSHTVTMAGLGTNNGLPVAFTIVAAVLLPIYNLASQVNTGI